MFSRYPIVTVCAHRFTINGSLPEIKDGEIFTGKSILLCRIHTSAGDIAFYNTHVRKLEYIIIILSAQDNQFIFTDVTSLCIIVFLHNALYSTLISQTNPKNRDSQLLEVYQFVEATRGPLPVILVGDFNTKPTHLAYSILTKCLRLQDVFQDDPVDTCDLKSNIFTESHMTPKRIDFVLFSPCAALELKVRIVDAAIIQIQIQCVTPSNSRTIVWHCLVRFQESHSHSQIMREWRPCSCSKTNQ